MIKAVFMGDSITQAWFENSPDFFIQNQYVASGINGQTTPQMLARFNSDVINLQPNIVVILAGTNDIAGNSGPSTNKMIQDNLTEMADLATKSGIKVILCSILPADDYPWRKGLKPAQRIIEMNSWMNTYCKENNLHYLDYWKEMANEHLGMKKELTTDGVHVSKSGYSLMEKLARPVINKASNI